MLKSNHEFLFVGKDDNSFLENYAYDLFEDHGDKSGQIFLTLEIQNNPVDAEDLASVMFETMQKMFFEDINMDPYDRFEHALKEVNRVLKEFQGKKFSGYVGNLNVVIAAIVGDTLYLTQVGDAEAYLVRKHYVSVVTEGLGDDDDGSGDIFSNIASGQLMPGDFVIFSSTRLLRYIGQNDLAKCINKDNPGETLAEISDAISTEMLGKLGMTGVSLMEVRQPAAIGDNLEVKEEHMDSVTVAPEQPMAAMEEEEPMPEVRSERTIRPKRKARVSDAMRSVTGFFSGLGSKMPGLKNRGGQKMDGKNKILVLLVGVIVVLLISIWIASSRSAVRAELEELDKILLSVQDKVAEAETKGTFDKEGAKETLDKAYQDAMKVLNSGYYREKAKLYLVEIEEARDNLDNVQRIENPTLVADLSEKRSDVSAIGFTNIGDRVFVYEYNALYELVLDQVQDPITLDDEESVIDATGFDDRDSIVFLTRSGKLLEYREGTVSFMDTDDGTFRQAVAIDDWSNRIYLLDPTNSQVWRYTYKGTRDAFGGAEDYLSGADLDLSAGKDVAIDASVYVLENDGGVQKFYSGSQVEFFINKAPLNIFSDASRIFTNERVGEVYVVDSEDSRVFVYDKDEITGNVDYRTQYLFDGIGEVRDVYVNPDSRKMLILTESKVYELDV